MRLRSFLWLLLLLGGIAGWMPEARAQRPEPDGRTARRRNVPEANARTHVSETSLRRDVLRVETAVFEDDRPFTVLPLNELGVAVVMNQNAIGSSGSGRSLAFYDENLLLRWQTSIEVEAGYQYIGYRLGADSLHFALSCLPHYKSERPLAALSVCLADGAWQLRYLPVALPAKLEILSLQMRDGGWGFLSMEKDRFVWYYLPLDGTAVASDAVAASAGVAGAAEAGSGTGAAAAAASATASASALPFIRTPLGIDDGQEWCHLTVDTATGQIYTLFRDRKLRQNGLTLCRHGWQGENPAGFELLPPDEGLRLIDARMSVLPGGRLWLGGTYHLSREKQTVSTYDRGSETTGLFAALYATGAADNAGPTAAEPKRLTFWKRAYYDFPDLEHRLSREAWYDLQRAQEKSKGRTLIPAFTAQIRVGQAADAETSPGAPLYVLGEVYTRLVNTTTEMYYDAYGRMVPYTRTYFEGFRFRDGFLARFDSLGHAVSETVFDLDRNRRYDDLTEYSQWAADSTGRTLYVYPIDDQLAYRVLGSVYGASDEPTAFQLPLLYQYDKVQKSWGGVLTPWYGRHFLAFGYQQIRNTRLSQSRRNVFYLQKITVE